MLSKIIDFSVKNKLVIGLLVLFLVGYGLYQTTKLPIDAVPDITDNQVQIITVAPSLGAIDIERLITFPIEQANSNIAGIEEIRSFSRFGLSLVTIVFSEATNVYWARQQVSERLQKVQAEIPEGISKPELGPITTGLGEIYQYVLKAKPGFENKYNTTDLRTLQDWIARRQLIGVKGVAEVSSFGGKLKQYEIAIENNKLNANGISINDVFNAVEKNNQNTGGSYIEKQSTLLFIRTEGLIGSIADIENIVIKHTSNGIPLLVKDVAKVQMGFATRYGAMCYNGDGEVAGGIVMMLKGENSSTVIDEVKYKVTQIQKTLPEGVMLEAFLDRTKMVKNAINTVEKNLVEGALIVVLVLVFFLGNFRAGLLVASVIPLSMLFAICLMNAFGVSGNLMSLGALDFGLIVDGAVIIVEAVMHQLSKKQKDQQPAILTSNEMDEKVSSSAKKMMSSAVFGQLIILIVYLPIFALHGIEGKMFKPMAQTVAFALLGAFILSITYIPMMSALALSKKQKIKANFSDKIMQKLEDIYTKLLTKAIKIPRLIIGITVILFAVALFTLSQLGGEFIPELEEGDFAVETRVLTGSNLNTTIDYCLKAAAILKKNFPEVEKVVAKIGSGEVPTDPMPIEAADMMVILKDKSKWTSAKTFDNLAAKMTEALQDLPGIAVSFQYPVQMRFNELMTGAKQDVVCKIFGENLDTLSLYAEKLGKFVNTVKGSQELYVETVTGIPQIVVNYNRALMAQYNINIDDVNRLVNTAFAGQTTGLVFEDEKRFDLVVKLDNQERTSFEDVQNLLIPIENGLQIPLHQIATVSIVNGPNQIQREDAKRRITVGFNIMGRDVESIVNELQAKVTKQLKLPSGYYVTFGGSFENLKKAKASLAFAVPIALLLIFILLFFAFKSLKQSFIIYSAIPLSAIGGIFFLALRGLPFSISAGIGFIALFGVAVLNGIVLIAEFNRLKNDGMQNLTQFVLEGAKQRLRPVLMTASVASLGFLPMALSHGAGAEVQRPLATVVIGGLIIATLLTLFVLPILYIWTEKKSKKMKLSKAVHLIVLLVTMMPFITKAQTTITLKNALDSVVKNNLFLKNNYLQSEYAKALINTAKNIPSTTITGDFGQMNSVYFDTKIGISQSFQLSKVYAQQRNFLTQEWKLAAIKNEITTLQLKTTTQELFYQYLYQLQKKKLLLNKDSIYEIAVKKANTRLEKGESNILEKTFIDAKKSEVSLQLLALSKSLETLVSEFHFLLNTKEKYLPFEPSFKLSFSDILDLNSTNNHPLIKWMAQQINIAEAGTLLDKQKLSPEIILGYNNTSIRGVGADEKLYSGSYRFQNIQAGVAIPLFTKSLKAKIDASKINEKIISENFSIETKSLKNKLQIAINEFKLNKETIDLFEKNYLKNAFILIETANAQYNFGEINYLHFTTIIDQVFTIQHNYIDAIHQYNLSILNLQYLTSK